jgi:flagellar biosynthesis/type III secretory pathway M-ring protein FliF/YscJ
MDSYLWYFYVVVVFLIMIVVSFILFNLKRQMDRRKLDKMSKEHLEAGAEKIVRQYKDKMERQNQKY